MRVERIDVSGFRRLSGPFEFAPGLTLVTGPNEAGKSTLHELLVRVLFGFSSSERRRTGGQSHKDRCQPWSGAPFRASARLRDRTDRLLAVEWDFEQHSVTLRDSDTGEDLSSQVRGRREDVVLGEFLLRMGLEEFRDVCCLHQAAMAAVEGSEPLKLLLQRSVETGAADVGVEDADGRLSAFLREDLGVHSGYYRPLAKGRLAAMEAERQEAEAMLEECEAIRREVGQFSEQLYEMQVRERELRAALERTDQTILLTRLRELESRFASAHALEMAAADRPEHPVSIPEALVQQVRDARLRAVRSSGEISDLEQRVREHGAKVSALRSEQAALREEADALSSYAELNVSFEESARTLEVRLEADLSSPAPVAKPKEPPPSFPRDRFAFGAAVAVAIISAGLGVVVHPGAFAGLAVAALLLVAARRQHAPQGIALDLSPEGRDDPGERQAALERNLSELLDEAGAARRGPLAERVSAYLVGCGKRRRMLECKARLDGIAGQLIQAEQPARELESHRRELEGVESELRAAYLRVQIDGADLRLAAEEFDELVRAAERDSEHIVEANTAQRELAASLGGATTTQLEESLNLAGQAHREHVARVGELVSEPGNTQALTAVASETGRDLHELERSCAALETRIAEREEGQAEPAELRRRLEEVEAELEASRRGVEAIQIARTELAEAAREAHRAFAPHLREALERNLPRITGGRYTEATIDESLQIQIVAPETGHLVRAEWLSRGTQDQIFLVERLEIARLLDPTTGDAPLLLDDPFDHFDDDRLSYGLEMLGEVAAERQVVLFAEESDLVARTRAVCGDCHVIELAGPAVRA